MDQLDKVLGGMAGAVIGDSMGTATETMTPRRIHEVYGRLDDLVPAEYSPFSSGRPAGHCSDDSRQMLLLAERFSASGTVTVEAVVDSILAFAEDPVLMGRNTGPTTRVAIPRLLAGEDPLVVGRGDPYLNTGTSNGAASKCGPAGWLNPGDIPGAVRDAATICAPSHNTQIAIAGASAISAGIAVALLDGSTVDDVVAACLEGARLGEELGLRVGREVAGASLIVRIQIAVDLARAASDIVEAGEQIGRIVGGGIQTNEAVPAAIGLFVAANGDAREAIVAAVNLGDDTDTVACICGMLAGTFSGTASIPRRWIDTVTEVNHLDLPTLAEAVVSAAKTRTTTA